MENKVAYGGLITLVRSYKDCSGAVYSFHEFWQW